jgi:hypothetical protein
MRECPSTAVELRLTGTRRTRFLIDVRRHAPAARGRLPRSRSRIRAAVTARPFLHATRDRGCYGRRYCAHQLTLEGVHPGVARAAMTRVVVIVIAQSRMQPLSPLAPPRAQLAPLIITQ